MKGYRMKSTTYFPILFLVAAIGAATFAARAQMAEGLAVTIDSELRVSAVYSDLGEVRATIPLAEMDAAIQEFFNTPGLEEASKERIVRLVVSYTGLQLEETVALEAARTGLLRASVDLLPGRLQVTGDEARGFQLSGVGFHPPFDWAYSASERGVYPLVSTAVMQPVISPNASIAAELRPFAEFLAGNCQYKVGPFGELRREGLGWLVSIGGTAEAAGCDGFLGRAPRALHQFLPGENREALAAGLRSLMQPLAAHGIYRPEYLRHLRKVSVQVVLHAR